MVYRQAGDLGSGPREGRRRFQALLVYRHDRLPGGRLGRLLALAALLVLAIAVLTLLVGLGLLLAGAAIAAGIGVMLYRKLKRRGARSQPLPPEAGLDARLDSLPPPSGRPSLSPPRR